jgi:predicted metal-binding membrane protein
MWPRVRDQRLFLVSMAGLIALAWLSLWLWKESPSGRFLSHRENEGVHGVGGHYLALAAVFAAGWMLMTVAMMLPTSLPLVAVFRAVVRRRSDRLRLVVLLIAGYLFVWMLFAVVVHGVDLLIHRSVDEVGWLHAHAWIISAVTVLWAGIYQFTPLKYRCLDKCRSPVSFVIGHWRGGNEPAEAFHLGVHHGLFCVGCCWSLMLLMFAVGVGSIGWMLVLGAVMAVEKNVPWGRRLSAPLGIALVAWGVVLVVTGSPGPGGVQ